MNVNWITAYNRLFKIINTDGDYYYSGSAFIRMAQQVDDSIPNYNQFIELRTQQGKSTSRNDFYWDIIKSLDDAQKYQLFRLFIEALEPYVKDEVEGVRSIVFGGGSAVPTTVIPKNLWNSEKLNLSLKDIDKAIDSQQFNRAVTLSYTCMEGLYKAYITENIPDKTHINDLIPLSRLVKNDISAKLEAKGDYPKEIVNTIPTLTYSIANSRNNFSESHFDKDANKWLAIYARDLMNSVGRLLLHFM